jgi:uncharacterized protein (DUF2461 family)
MTSSVPVFTGWPDDATAFLAELARHNDAEFWAAQRHRYDTAVRPPTAAIAVALEAEFGPVRVLRPYRSRRFQPSAPPYRTDAGAVSTTEGGTERSFALSPAGLAVRIGRYAFEGQALRRFRAAVDGEAGEQLTTMLGELAAEGLVVPDDVPTLSTRPRDCPADHPRLALLRLRALHVGRAWEAGPWLATHEPLARVAGAWRAAEPLVAWLDEYIGS